MTMIEEHELAFAILAWIGILTLPVFYVALYIAIRWTDRREAIADRSASAPRRETGVARKGESGGAGTAIAQTPPSST